MENPPTNRKCSWRVLCFWARLTARLYRPLPKLPVPINWLLLILSPISLEAQPVWQAIGPPGGKVRTVVMSPSNPQVIYTATFDGVLFKTIDGGQTAITCNDTSGPQFTVDQIAVSPVDENRIFVSVYRSVDGGRSWQRMTPGGNSYAINRVNPYRAYCVSFDSQIWTTSNSGEQWSRLYTFTFAKLIRLSPSDTSTLYAVAADSILSIFKSTNAGLSWTTTTYHPQSDVGDIEIDPQDSHTLFVGTANEGVMKTTNSGRNWDLVLATKNVNDLTINQQNPNIVVAVTGDYRQGVGGHVYISTNGGLSWTIRNSGLPDSANRFVYSIAADHAQTTVLYAGLHGYGVYRSSNFGQEWQQTNASRAGALSIKVDTRQHQIYVGTEDQGLAMTSDAGNTWRLIDFGLPKTISVPCRQIRFQPTNAATAYATAGPAGLFKTTDYGLSWQLTNLQSDPDSWVWSSNISHQVSNLVLAGKIGFGQQDLFRSTDAGNSWSNTRLTNNQAGIENILFDQHQTSLVYACAGQKGFYRSSNSGLTWNSANTGLRFITSSLLAPVRAIDKPGNGNILYVVQGSSGTNKGGVFKSTNDGDMWLSIDSTLTNLDRNINGADLQISTTDRAIIYLALEDHGQVGTSSYSHGGLFATSDDGSAWTVLRRGSTTAVAIDSFAFQRKVYIGTRSGVYRTDLVSSVQPNHEEAKAVSYALQQNYPNPFNAGTMIHYRLVTKGHVKLKIFDILGNEVMTAMREHEQPGLFTFYWNGTDTRGFDMPSGVYFCRLELDSYFETKKMTLIR